MPTIPQSMKREFGAVRAHYGSAIYQSEIRFTEEGVEELRKEILHALPFQAGCPILISIPGGRA